MLYMPFAIRPTQQRSLCACGRRVSVFALSIGLAAGGAAWAATTAFIPASTARAHAGGLRGTTNGRPSGYLGIEIRDSPTPPSVNVGNSARGVEVVMVDHDGPAGKAGLKPHDLIMSLNGQVTASADALKRMIHDAGAGMQVALSVLRNGRLMTLNAQLATRDEVARAAMAHLAASSANAAPQPPAPQDGGNSDPAEAPAPEPDSAPAQSAAPLPPHSQGFLSSMLHSGSSTGIMLDVMEPQLALYFGAPQGIGLLVQSVEAGSVGAQAGLHAGDVLLRADMYTMHSQADWTKRLHAAKGRPLTLSILRDRREMTLTLLTDLKHHSLLEWPIRSGQ